MSNLNYHQLCHYNDLKSFIDDLKAEFGEDTIEDILSYHDQLLEDLLNFDLDNMENFEYEN